MMTTVRTTHSVIAKELLPRRSHDLRWLRLHPQLLGADAARGRTKLIEHIDVALADAPAAPELLAGEEPRRGAIADREARSLAEAAEDGRRDVEGEVVVVGERDAVALHEA